MAKTIERVVSDATIARKTAALKWFMDAAKVHNVKLAHAALNVQKTKTIRIGDMIHFLYDAKYKDKLPYWDKIPLVFPITIYNNGFLGINLHYLPVPLRIKLLDALISNLEKSVNKGKYTERRYLEINYAILQQVAKSSLYSVCIKRYLTTHIKSTIIKVSGQYWEDVALLPTAKFEKQSAVAVWRVAKRLN